MGKEGEDPRRKMRPGPKAAMGRSMLRRARPPPRTRYVDGSDAPWRLLSCGYISFARPLGGAMRTARYCMRRTGAGRACGAGAGGVQMRSICFIGGAVQAFLGPDVRGPRGDERGVGLKAGGSGTPRGRDGSSRGRHGPPRPAAGPRRDAVGRGGGISRGCVHRPWDGSARDAACERLQGACGCSPRNASVRQEAPRAVARKGCAHHHASAPVTPAACGEERCRRQGVGAHAPGAADLYGSRLAAQRGRFRSGPSSRAGESESRSAPSRP